MPFIQDSITTTCFNMAPSILILNIFYPLLLKVYIIIIITYLLKESIWTKVTLSIDRV